MVSYEVMRLKAFKKTIYIPVHYIPRNFLTDVQYLFIFVKKGGYLGKCFNGEKLSLGSKMTKLFKSK